MTQFTEIKEAINPAQQVIARNVISEVESVEELILRSRLTNCMQTTGQKQASAEFFNTIACVPSLAAARAVHVQWPAVPAAWLHGQRVSQATAAPSTWRQWPS